MPLSKPSNYHGNLDTHICNLDPKEGTNDNESTSSPPDLRNDVDVANSDHLHSEVSAASAAAREFVADVGLSPTCTSLLVAGVLLPATIQDLLGSEDAVTARSGSGCCRRHRSALDKLMILALTVLPLAQMASAGCLITPDGNGNVVIPSSTTSIANNAFYNCYSLKTVTFASGSSLGSIGTSAFYQSGLTTISLPSECYLHGN